MSAVIGINESAFSNGAAARARGANLFLGLEVVDPELIAELEKYQDGAPREKYLPRIEGRPAVAIQRDDFAVDNRFVRQLRQRPGDGGISDTEVVVVA